MYSHMEIYRKGITRMYTELWKVECDWKPGKNSLFALILVYLLKFCIMKR